MITVVIPVRLQSHRLPGKPLLDVEGKPLLWHTWRNAVDWVGEDCVHVATGNKEVLDVCHQLGISTIVTDDTHPTGTLRVLEAADSLNIKTYNGATNDILVNLQCDEPEVTPDMLTTCSLSLLEHTSRVITTLSCELLDEERQNPNVVKVVRWGWKAAYFSRAPLGAAEAHIGVYMFRCSHLGSIRSVKRTPAGIEESLEQLDWLSYGLPMGVERVEGRPLVVNTVHDYKELCGSVRARNNQL